MNKVYSIAILVVFFMSICIPQGRSGLLDRIGAEINRVDDNVKDAGRRINREFNRLDDNWKKGLSTAEVNLVQSWDGLRRFSKTQFGLFTSWDEFSSTIGGIFIELLVHLAAAFGGCRQKSYRGIHLLCFPLDKEQKVKEAIDFLRADSNRYEALRKSGGAYGHVKDGVKAIGWNKATALSFMGGPGIDYVAYHTGGRHAFVMVSDHFMTETPSDRAETLVHESSHGFKGGHSCGLAFDKSHSGVYGDGAKYLAAVSTKGNHPNLKTCSERVSAYIRAITKLNYRVCTDDKFTFPAPEYAFPCLFKRSSGDTEFFGHPMGPDKCPNIKGVDSRDTDKDGLGDSCDNCWDVSNANQADRDGDGLGDACDDDKDGDKILNDVDNCPFVANFHQLDLDKDLNGDLCDPDIDNDRILNDKDNCPHIASQDQSDGDGDGVGDLCDSTPDGADIDNDGTMDKNDNCPIVFNPNQENMDGDRFGDVCDDDIDGDHVLNAQDNCPRNKNEDQSDQDQDKKGDACDKHLDIVTVAGGAALSNMDLKEIQLKAPDYIKKFWKGYFKNLVKASSKKSKPKNLESLVTVQDSQNPKILHYYRLKR